MTQPITIYLIGRAGAGKYTIAKELKKFDYKIIDNHLVNNPIFSLLNHGEKISNIAWDAIEKIRDAILGFISKDKASNYVMTNELLESEYDHNIFNKVKAAAAKRNSIFIPIKLHITYEENTRRIKNPERAKRYKTLKIKPLNELQKLIQIEHENLIEIDISTLQADIVALRIIDTTIGISHRCNLNQIYL
jgi:hypothetical protein